MKRFTSVCTVIILTLFTLSGYSQNPDYVDPGNVRGDEGTAYLWENPNYYIPVMVVVILVVAIGIMRRRKNNT